MSTRAERLRNAAVRYWADAARCLSVPRGRELARERAWENALHTAENAPGWLIRGGILIEIVKRGPRGGIYGRRWYKTRKPGTVRSW